ncbi:hypothetical protein ACU686_05130 [Yinghuangia aomiensis]
MMRFSRAWLVDVAERTGATAAEAGLAYLITVLASLPTPWAVPITGALAIAKGAIASRYGEHGTAAALPAPKPDLGPAFRSRE